MDVGALAASLVAMQAGALQQQVATRMVKMNLDTEASAVQTLLQPTPSSSANLAAGIGGNLDIRA